MSVKFAKSIMQLVTALTETPLKPGDRHILFLNYDRRTIVPTYPRTDGNFPL